MSFSGLSPRKGRYGFGLIMGRENRPWTKGLKRYKMSVDFDLPVITFKIISGFLYKLYNYNCSSLKYFE